jgi:hypothetical protein
MRQLAALSRMQLKSYEITRCGFGCPTGLEEADEMTITQRRRGCIN